MVVSDRLEEHALRTSGHPRDRDRYPDGRAHRQDRRVRVFLYVMSYHSRLLVATVGPW
jgi:hypothetical protein